MTVRTDLNKAFIKKIKDAYLNMARDDYAAFSSYVQLYYPKPVKMEYVSVVDSQYNGLRRMAGDIKDLKFDK